MIAPGRPSISVNAALALRHVETELLGGDLLVMIDAKVARVAVDVGATVGQRLDMVDARRDGGAAKRETHLAKAVGAGEASLAVALAGPAALAFNHSQSPIEEKCGPPTTLERLAVSSRLSPGSNPDRGA
jgi:hypothetical protein